MYIPGVTLYRNSMVVPFRVLLWTMSLPTTWLPSLRVPGAQILGLSVPDVFQIMALGPKASLCRYLDP